MVRKKKSEKTKVMEKCDKILQEIGREVYGEHGCLVCGGEYSCLHHYVKKSQSKAMNLFINRRINVEVLEGK